jgi:hypothetical protein
LNGVKQRRGIYQSVFLLRKRFLNESVFLTTENTGGAGNAWGAKSSAASPGLAVLCG